MKIAWFTPFSKTSAIGRASRLITDELARLAEVHIWHPEAAELHPSTVRLISYAPTLRLSPIMLEGYDLVVYNLGNYLPFHRQIFEISRETPGLLVLHDFVMHHFFASYHLEHKQKPQDYLSAMVRHYGQDGGRETRDSHSGSQPWIWETDRVGDFPLFEETLRGAWGVVVHSEFFRERVSAVFPGLVKKLGLAYRPESGSRVQSRDELGIPAGKTVIITIGHVNPNKRIQSVLEAMARRPELREHLFYAIVGPCDESYHRLLDEFLALHGLKDSVRFFGYASDEQLRSFLTHSDICINLRHPFTEGASASAIEEMLYGKPVVVSDGGFFRELPEDCVRKVNLASESADLDRVLDELTSNQQVRTELGERARTFAEANFRADKYAAGILEVAEELLQAKPLLQHTDRIGGILSEMGVSANMPVVDTVTRICSEMFCGGDHDPADAIVGRAG